jgi:hypothetical protein
MGRLGLFGFCPKIVIAVAMPMPIATAFTFSIMAGLGLFDQKSAITATMPIATAFKLCIRHRKNGLLNR